MICTQFTQQLATDPTGLGLIAFESGQVFGHINLCFVHQSTWWTCQIQGFVQLVIRMGQDVFKSIQSPPLIANRQKVSFMVLHIEWFPSGLVPSHTRAKIVHAVIQCAQRVIETYVTETLVLS